jgi:hypothetical protein
MVMAATSKLKTTQIDFSKWLFKAEVQENVHIKLTTGFGSRVGVDYVLKLDKSLYGLCQASKSY